MTIKELIQLLEEHDEDSEVQLQTQRNYPLRAVLYGVTDQASVAEMSLDSDDDDDEPHGDDCKCRKCVIDTTETPGVVYIVEGEQQGYGDSAAWSTAQRW